MKDEDLPPLQDLLKPVSAKDHKPRMGMGGRVITNAVERKALARSLQHAVQRRKTDAARRKAGTL